MHLDRAIAALGALAAQICRHLDAEVLLRGNRGHGVGGVDGPLLEVGGDDFTVGGGEVDDGDVGCAGVGGLDVEG